MINDALTAEPVGQQAALRPETIRAVPSVTASPMDFDLVIVGCGAAGLAAAVTFIEARAAANQPPATVAILERSEQSQRGGSMRWTAAAMRVNDKFRLDPRWVGRVQEVSHQLADLKMCEVFEDAVPDTCNFLIDHGVELFGGPSSFEGMSPIQRPNGGGLAIVDGLARVVEDADGSDIFYEMEALRLSVSDEGRVNGVVARSGHDGLLKTFSGRAVLLACGGFEGNPQMLTQYVGNNSVALRELAPGIRFNTGDGIAMATDVGAATAGQFDGIHAELVDARTDRADAVLKGHTWTIAVDGDAKRFYDEGAKNFSESFELIAYDVWKNRDQTAFLITDDAVMSRDILTSKFESDIPPAKADTICDLAIQLGLDPDALQATVDAFNAACNDKEFDPMRLDGKSTSGLEPPKSNWANPLNHPPFYGYPVAAAICFTFGGLKTDSRARVVSRSGTVIPGLYAAGELVGLFYYEYPAATSVLRALAFGRIAGVDVAQQQLQAVATP